LSGLFGRPDFDTEQLTRVAVDDDGRLRAFGVLWRGSVLGMLVHSGARGTVERSLLHWAERAVHTTSVISGQGNDLRVMCRDDDDILRPLLDQSGFRILGRELRMVRDLTLPIPLPELPAGFTLGHVRTAEGLAEWVGLYNEAFGRTDIPGPTTVARWQARIQDPDYDPELHIVVLDDNGAIASTCFCSVAAAEARQSRRREGRTEPIATAIAYRRRGLARAAILAGMRALRARSMNLALLTTDAGNVDAHRLYESVGYRATYSALWMTSTSSPHHTD
jgi:mycothiol synthase